MSEKKVQVSLSNIRQTAYRREAEDARKKAEKQCPPQGCCRLYECEVSMSMVEKCAKLETERDQLKARVEELEGRYQPAISEEYGDRCGSCSLNRFGICPTFCIWEAKDRLEKLEAAARLVVEAHNSHYCHDCIHERDDGSACFFCGAVSRLEAVLEGVDDDVA